MSILSNLLAFSSLNNSTQRQQRASSASSRFLFQDEPQKPTQPKQRIASKSLSKMGLLSNSHADKVDKKSLKLHKFVSKLSRKVQKHYYGFFVTLETMKKNNVSVKKKQLIDPDKLHLGIAKVAQTFSIRYLKQYENSYKTQFFNKIKNFSQKAQLAKVLERVCINSDYKLSSIKLFNYMKSLQKLQMKIELIQGALNQIIKKHDKSNINSCFLAIKQQIKDQKNKQKKQISVFQMFDNLQKKVNSSPPRSQIDNLSAIKMQTKTSNFSDSVMQVDQQHSKIISNSSTIEPSISHKTKQPASSNKFNSLEMLMDYRQNIDEKQQIRLKQQQNSSIPNSLNQNQNFSTPYQNRTHFIQSNPVRNFSSRSKSPFKICKKINNLKQSVQVDSLEAKNYPKIYKSYNVICNYTQMPYGIIPKAQSVPKIMNKITPQEFSVHQVEDLADKSNIFRDFKSSKFTEIDMLQISNVVAEPFQRAETLISDMQKNRQKCESSNQRSQLSYYPYLPHEGSISSINHRQRQQSSFGCDAVNFKNSLVLQRQSMKKPQRQKIDMFIKRKTYVNSNQMVDSQSQHVANLKNKKYKNEQSNRKIQPSPIVYNNSYESSYGFDSDYLKRDLNNYEIPRSTTPVMHSVYPSFNWDAKKSQNQLNSQGKNKSFSFNSNSSDSISRRNRFNNTSNQFERKTPDQGYIPSLSFSTNGFKDQIWKNQPLGNQRQMPVRDVGMEPISKLRMKNSAASHHQNTINKEPQYPPKKFINISKR